MTLTVPRNWCWTILSSDSNPTRELELEQLPPGSARQEREKVKKSHRSVNLGVIGPRFASEFPRPVPSGGRSNSVNRQFTAVSGIDEGIAAWRESGGTEGDASGGRVTRRTSRGLGVLWMCSDDERVTVTRSEGEKRNSARVVSRMMMAFS